MIIAALADLHGYMPDLPQADLYILAGDLCIDKCNGGGARDWPRGQAEWFQSHIEPWLSRHAPRAVVMVWGNHDYCGHLFNSPLEQHNLLPPLHSLWADVDASVLDPMTDWHTEIINGLTIWGSPWSNKFCDWAYMKSERELAEMYDYIPDGTDIIISHGPPYGYGDLTYDGRHVGSPSLLRAIDRVKPKVVITGHIHEAFGKYRHMTTDIYNVSIVNSRYQHVNPVTMITL